jgi:ribonuclease HI
VRELHGLELDTTGDRIGLLAVVRALECLKRPVRVQVHTSSEYLRRGMTEWLPELRRNGWTAGEAGTIIDIDLWRELATAMKGHEFELCPVSVPSEPGHERAVALASQEFAQARAQLPDSEPNCDSDLNDPADPHDDYKVALAARIRILKSLAENQANLNLDNPLETFRRLRELIASNQEQLPLSEHLLPLIDQALAGAESDDQSPDGIARLRRTGKVISVIHQIGLCNPHAALEALEWLAGTLVIFKSADAGDVLRGLVELTNHGLDLPPLIAKALLARASGDPGAMFECVQEILNHPALVSQIFPSRRRARRSDVVTYRIRIDFKGAKPPLWRRLELASDLYLNDLNKIIESVFEMSDDLYSDDLYIFASGSGLHHKDAEHYLCPQETQEGKGGIPDIEVRLDEVLVDVGDKLFYAYYLDDVYYRDDEMWEFVIKLEAIGPRDRAAPQALCTAGRQPDDRGRATRLNTDQINKGLSNLDL